MRAVIADDSVLLREGITRLLAEGDIDVVAGVGDAGALPGEVVRQLLARSRRADPLGGLAPREREVLALMAEGRSSPAIAETLVVSMGAVESGWLASSSSSTCPPTMSRRTAG